MHSFFYRVLLAGLFSLLLYAPLLAQKVNKPLSLTECGTRELNPQQRQALEAEAAFALRIKQATQGKATVLTYVPIRPHILRRSNGTGGFTLSQLNQVMALTNSRFLQGGVGIQFYLAGTTPDYVDNDTWFANFDGVEATEDAIANSRDATNAMNAYFTQTMPYNGYAYYPANRMSSTRMFLNGTLDTYYLGSGTMPHELGHNFNLMHTFGSTSTTTELVTRGAGANCTTAGDLVCDTPADPGRSYPGFATAIQNGCDAYTGTCVDANGATFSPDVTNLMSYYNSTACRSFFSTGQYTRIDAGLAVRQSHTAYTLNFPSTTVNAPTNIIAASSGAGVTVTWTDNASNEMGYFVERSTAPTTGFVAIGGVAPNVTSFADTKAPGSTTAYYRIRPSNSTGGISTIVSVVTPACRPIFSNGCDSGDGINSFSFNNTLLSQNTGCGNTATSYSQYTATTAAVTAGVTYPFSGTLLSTIYTEGIAIWADLNRNGSFSDAGELLFQRSPASTSFGGSLTVPVGTSAGLLPIRIVAAENVTPGNPCGSYSYGETEDYVLTVTGGTTCTAMTTTKAGDWTDPTVWSCNRVPVSTDVVSVGHTISVPTAVTGRALKITYGAGGRVSFSAGGRVRLGP